MLGKLKNILGIEGVKISISLDDPIDRSEGAVFGKINLSSLSDQLVERIELKLIEKYSRGRGESKLIDEYELGTLILAQPITVKKDQEISIPFTLPYNEVLSEMDEFGNENIFSRGLSLIAKRFKAVKSRFRVVAKAKVKGTSLDPIVSREVILE